MKQSYLLYVAIGIFFSLNGCKTPIKSETADGNGFEVMSANGSTRELEKLGCICESANEGWTLSSYWLAKDGAGHRKQEKSGQGDIKNCYLLRPSMEAQCGEELQ
jgi:hypothetical protein